MSTPEKKSNNDNTDSNAIPFIKPLHSESSTTLLGKRIRDVQGLSLGKRIRLTQQQLHETIYDKISNYDTTAIEDLILESGTKSRFNQYVDIQFNDPRLPKPFDSIFTMKPGKRDLWAAMFWKNFEQRTTVRVQDIPGEEDTGLRFYWNSDNWTDPKGPHELAEDAQYLDVTQQISLQNNKTNNL